MAQCCALLCSKLAGLTAHQHGGRAGPSTVCRSASLPTCRYWIPLISPTPWYTRRAGSLRSLLHLQAVVAGGGRESGRRREKQDGETGDALSGKWVVGDEVGGGCDAGFVEPLLTCTKGTACKRWRRWWDRSASTTCAGRGEARLDTAWHSSHRRLDRIFISAARRQPKI